MSQVPISCIAVVGPDESLLLICKDESASDDLELDSLVFCSLDYFSQSRSGRNALQNIGRNEKFANICNKENYMVFGYRAPLSYKIVIVIPFVQNPNEAAIRSICERTKDVLFDAISDPFYAPFSPIFGLKNRVKAIASTKLPSD